METMGIDQYAWSYIVGYSNGSQFEHEAVDNASNFELITYRYQMYHYFQNKLIGALIRMDEVFLHNIDAVFDLDVRRPLTRVKVKPLYTVFNGKCYVIEILDMLKAYEVMIVDLGYVWSNKSVSVCPKQILLLVLNFYALSLSLTTSSSFTFTTGKRRFI